MEQRASALQQRLEARRNMFLKGDGTNNSSYGANRPITSGKHHSKILISCHLDICAIMAILFYWEETQISRFLCATQLDI